MPRPEDVEAWALALDIQGSSVGRGFRALVKRAAAELPPRLSAAFECAAALFDLSQAPSASPALLHAFALLLRALPLHAHVTRLGVSEGEEGA